jgi:hypothetical protein
MISGGYLRGNYVGHPDVTVGGFANVYITQRHQKKQDIMTSVFVYVCVEYLYE